MNLNNEQIEAIDQLVMSLQALCEPDDPLDLLPS